MSDGKPIQKTAKPDQKLWDLIAKNIEWVNYASLSNSFLILQVLNDAEKPLSAGQVSERISSNSMGRIYKVSATLRDGLEHRLMRERLVQGVELENQTTDGRRVKTLHFQITAKGKALLKGWTAFIRAYS